MFSIYCKNAIIFLKFLKTLKTLNFWLTFKNRHLQSGGYFVITKLKTLPTTGISASASKLNWLFVIKWYIMISIQFKRGFCQQTYHWTPSFVNTEHIGFATFFQKFRETLQKIHFGSAKCSFLNLNFFKSKKVKKQWLRLI